MTANNNRKIQLYLSGGKKDDDKAWRYNFSRILGYQTSRGENLTQLFSTFDTTSMNVDNSIDLLMLSTPKTPTTKNAFDTPISTLTSTLGKSNIVGAISSMARIGANVISVFNDVKPSEISESNRTARVFQPWSTNVKSWAGSIGSINFEYDFKFALGQYGLWNAKEEVVKPILNLVAPAFPQYVSNYSMAGPFPSTAELLYRMIVDENASTAESYITEINNNISSIDSVNNGNSLKSNFENAASSIGSALENLGTFLANVVTKSFNNFTYTLEFGNIVQFKNLIITNAKTSFSNEVDQNGFPISGSATLNFEGLVPQALTYNTENFGTIRMFGYGEN